MRRTLVGTTHQEFRTLLVPAWVHQEVVRTELLAEMTVALFSSEERCFHTIEPRFDIFVTIYELKRIDKIPKSEVIARFEL